MTRAAWLTDSAIDHLLVTTTLDHRLMPDNPCGGRGSRRPL
jgi:hypothetical protein